MVAKNQRAVITAENTYNSKPTALDKLTGQSSETVKQPNSEFEKVSFYLRPDQIDKLDELTFAYKKRTGKRINRIELVRQLIDLCTLDMLTEQES